MWRRWPCCAARHTDPVRWLRTSTIDHVPRDPVGDAMAKALSDVLSSGVVELGYSPTGSSGPVAIDPSTASARGPGPDGWDLTVTVRLDLKTPPLQRGNEPLAEVLGVLPDVGLATATAFRPLRAADDPSPLSAPLRRAMRDSIAAGILTRYLEARIDDAPARGLVSETIEFLVELSSTRVESHDLTHGVLITDQLTDRPRLAFNYPTHVRQAKRAPLLFDGQRSVLVVDEKGNARTELQRHRFDRLDPGGGPAVARGPIEMVESGSLVAWATALLGGLGLYLRSDRSIWTFVDGQPLLVRRGEHWRAFPFELAASLGRMIGDSRAVSLVTNAAFLISAQPLGAILAIVEDADALDGIVPTKDRYDLRNDIDPLAMRTETRLHHLIDAEDLDERTIARLAGLDGATILDRTGQLLAYGAIVSSSESQHEGARTAAARTLSEKALVVLKVSVDGDITVFRGGKVIDTLLGGASA
jgi:DisA bacterial checkpoint controller nucleotide-binding